MGQTFLVLIVATSDIHICNNLEVLNFPINIHLYLSACVTLRVISLSVCVCGSLFSICFFSDIKYTHFLNWLPLNTSIKKPIEIRVQSSLPAKTSIETVLFDNKRDLFSATQLYKLCMCVCVSIVSLCVFVFVFVSFHLVYLSYYAVITSFHLVYFIYL